MSAVLVVAKNSVQARFLYDETAKHTTFVYILSYHSLYQANLYYKNDTVYRIKQVKVELQTITTRKAIIRRG